MFCILLAAALFVPFVFVANVWFDHRKRKWSWLTQHDLAMYIDLAKTLITASGIAVAVVASTLGKQQGNALRSAKFAVEFLLTSVVASIVVIAALSRIYTRARSRLAGERKPEDNLATNQGKLSDSELLWLLGLAYVGFAGFLAGMLSLGRIVFQL